MDKLVKLIEMLRAKKATLKWEETVEDGYYQTAFPKYVLAIGPRPDSSGMTDYVVKILNSNNAVIEEFSDVDIKDGFDSAGQDSSFSVMKEIHNAARRSAMGSDKALDEILKELDSDDIPF